MYNNYTLHENVLLTFMFIYKFAFKRLKCNIHGYNIKFIFSVVTYIILCKSDQ